MCWLSSQCWEARQARLRVISGRRKGSRRNRQRGLPGRRAKRRSRSRALCRLCVEALDGCGAREHAGAFVPHTIDEQPGNGLRVRGGRVGNGFAGDTAAVLRLPGGPAKCLPKRLPSSSVPDVLGIAIEVVFLGSSEEVALDIPRFRNRCFAAGRVPSSGARRRRAHRRTGFQETSKLGGLRPALDFYLDFGNKRRLFFMAGALFRGGVQRYFFMLMRDSTTGMPSDSRSFFWSEA
jgi:hypothetical protein